jgi:hypothetical protein
MNYSVEISPTRKSELTELITVLKNNPKQGVLLGSYIYKIRLPIASKGKGKSGDARIITYVNMIESRVILLTIYNKGDKDNITDNEIIKLLQEYL